MFRLSALFVAVCMALIAASLGAVLYLTFGLSGAESTVCALVALTGLAVFNAAATRAQMPATLDSQISDLARGTADLARQVAEQGRRLAALEKGADTAVTKALAVAQPMQAEIGELGQLVKQMAESIAIHELAIKKAGMFPMNVSPVRPAAAPAPVAAPAPAPSMVDVEIADVVVPAGPTPALAADGPFRGLSQQEIVALIRGAIEADRIDIYLQPIVTLPQRKVRYYEALARMRTADGQVVAAADFVGHAEAGGLIAKIDDMMLTRAMRVLRRLQLRNRESGLFLNVSPLTLADPVFVRMAEFMEANRAVAGGLMLEMPYSAFRAVGARESAVLSALAKLGFRFSVDRVSSLRFDAHELADRGCGFVKVPAAVLLDRSSQAASDIHPQDLAGLLARFNISLIAEKVETEPMAVDLLDFEVKFGQGNLFSAARPVRSETASQPAGEAVKEPAPAEAQAAAPASAELPPPSPPQPPAPASALARLARVVGRN